MVRRQQSVSLLLLGGAYAVDLAAPHFLRRANGGENL
jgi:hypothetical protein